jgi:rhamnogalacturonan endolyase
VWAFDYEGQSLQRRWTWSSLNEVDGYRYQAYHSLRVGDVDGDGRDEIVLGSCALDDNGQTLWVEYEGHCDRSILTDIDPSPAQPGLELWHCQGDAPNYQQPLTLRDAATGTRIFGPGESMIKDMRALAADIDPTGPGMEIWGAKSDLYDSNGGYISGNPGTCNFAVYWDGDPLRELLDDDVPGSIELFKWNYEQQTLTPLKTFEGELVGVADLFGDWREEIIVSTAGGIQVHTTIEPAKQRLVTLMHDAVYRLSVATETMGHMQTTQTGFFIGDGMTD